MKQICPSCSSPVASNGSCLRCLLEVGVEWKQASQRPVSDDNLPSIDELRRSFPQLEIVRLVGRGGMGAIYQARQTGLDRDVAIKIIDRRISKDVQFLERFEREARALAKLSHPNIVAVYDYGRTADGLAYLVMEYVNGLNLREAMDAMTIEASEAAEYVKTMCGALYYAHTKGVVHRDIKPENVLLGDDGSLKIADFGIAKIVDGQSPNKVTATRQVLGTPHYLAPEQLDAPNEVDHRVDLYAVGVVFYELLTRRLPIGTFEPPSQLNPSLDQRYDAVVAKSLSRRPTARFQSADELKRAIEIVAQNEMHAVPVAVPLAEPSSEPTQRSNVSVPFVCEDMAGFAEAKGTIHANREGVHVEYQVCDAIWGKIRSQLRTVSIPWDRIIQVQFQRGLLFSGKLIIAADSISVIQGLPHTDSGRFAAVINWENYELAERLCDRISEIRPNVAKYTKSDWTQFGQVNYALAVMLVFFAILNAGLLAIAEVLCAYHLSGWMLVVGAIACAVLLGPTVVAQIATGVLYAATGNKAIANMGVVTTMLPVSPLVPFGLPFGIWARGILGDGNNTHSNPSTDNNAKSWGATTLVYLRDSRNARIVSLLETLGCIVFFAAIGIFWFQCYPVMLTLRVVGASSAEVSLVEQESILKSLDSRIPYCTSVFQRNGNLSVRCWKYQQQNVLDNLAIASTPSLRCLVKSDRESTPSGAKYLPVLTGVPLDETANQKTNSGLELLCSDKECLLDSALVTKVEWVKSDQLRIVLSKKGDDELRRFLLEGGSSSRLGLMVEGWIEGVSVGSAQDRQIVFKMGDAAKRSHARIQAAIRGPTLPFEFELLN